MTSSRHGVLTSSHDAVTSKTGVKEFLLAINITSAGKPEQKLDWAFQMYDVNGDGTIDPTEMAEIIAAIYNMVGSSIGDGDPTDTPEKRTAEIFAKMDTNNDGVLSRDEFVRGCMTDDFLCHMLTANPEADQPQQQQQQEQQQ